MKGSARVRGIMLQLVGMAIAASAHGAMKPIEQALELPLGTVTLPASDSGQLVVRRCAECKPEILRVNTGTRYYIHPDRLAVTLRETRLAAVRSGANPEALVYVYYDATTRHVRRLVLDPGPALARAAP